MERGQAKAVTGKESIWNEMISSLRNRKPNYNV